MRACLGDPAFIPRACSVLAEETDYTWNLLSSTPLPNRGSLSLLPDQHSRRPREAAKGRWTDGTILHPQAQAKADFCHAARDIQSSKLENQFSYPELPGPAETVGSSVIETTKALQTQETG